MADVLESLKTTARPMLAPGELVLAAVRLNFKDVGLGGLGLVGLAVGAIVDASRSHGVAGPLYSLPQVAVAVTSERLMVWQGPVTRKGPGKLLGSVRMERVRGVEVKGSLGKVMSFLFDDGTRLKGEVKGSDDWQRVATNLNAVLARLKKKPWQSPEPLAFAGPEPAGAAMNGAACPSCGAKRSPGATFCGRCFVPY